MENISGSIERITYFNEKNGYTVLRLRPIFTNGSKIPGLDLEGLLTVVGNLPELSPGESVELEGEFNAHSKYGLQFLVNRCERVLPVTNEGIERYLGSGLIKGIGQQLSRRIVNHFKERTLEVIEQDPERLQQISGIGTDRKEKIVRAWKEMRKIKEIMLFLHSHNISTNLAVKIYKTYGDDSLEIVRNNPYKLEQDIHGIGFKTADQIAQNFGLASDHPARIEAGIVYAINESINEGHVYIPQNELVKKSQDLLGVDAELMADGIERLKSQDRIKLELDLKPDLDSTEKALSLRETTADYGQPNIYLSPFYFSERGVAKRILDLLQQQVQTQTNLFFHSKLSDEQEIALRMAVRNPVSVITGGPGTGKTTCLKALIDYLESQNKKYALTSPTGRAAKRLSEATARSASTIHRLLGYNPGQGFKYHDKNPLKIDFLVVDEASMLDLLLTYHLLKAVKPGIQVLFVGDVDQLPSVGAGDVLRDIINAHHVPVTRLNKIFRQSEGSEIISNAHRINRGKMPKFSKRSIGDFFLFPADDASKAAEWIVELVSDRIPNKFGLNPIQDIQVLTPLYRGDAGVNALNAGLQKAINPPNNKLIEQKLFGRIFRVGDKVMQVRNNYDKDIYNGDIGTISHINRIDQTINVIFDRSQKVIYDFTDADELVLAYAVSVHKSQGSEFPAIVIPVITQHYIMLQRNLIYTAVTRARELCVCVGNHKAFRIAINNNQQNHRYSNLTKRIIAMKRISY